MFDFNKQFGNLGMPDPQIQKSIDDSNKKREQAQQAAVDTAEYMRQTVETVEVIKSKVGDIETGLDDEREARIDADKSSKRVAGWGLAIAIFSFLFAVFTFLYSVFCT